MINRWMNDGRKNEWMDETMTRWVNEKMMYRSIYWKDTDICIGSLMNE